MRVVGFSGLDNSVAYKRRELPGLDKREYRIAQGMDSAAALVIDGTVLAAAAEERYTGEKATGAFPVHAFRDCLDRAGLAAGDLEAVAHGFAHQPEGLMLEDPYLAQRYSEVYDPAVQVGLLTAAFPGVDWASRFVPVPHHLAHAASAYYPSGYEEALVLVADGMGETESLTVAVGSGGKLNVLHRVPALHSLGTLYGTFTLYLGFDMAMDEYKVMGLAAFGDRRRYYPEMMRMVRLLERGSITVPVLASDHDLLQRETHSPRTRRADRAAPP
jgi:carbamoyltransferase